MNHADNQGAEYLRPFPWRHEMRYDAYIRRTTEAAASIRGKVVSLAGGYHGIQLPLVDDDFPFAILALDLEGCLGWAVWKETAQGERCCEHNYEELGWPPIRDLA